MGEPSSAVRVARGATYLVVQGLVSNLAAVVYFAFAARLLASVGDLGRLTTISLLSSLFITFGSLALPSAVVKYVSEYLGGSRLGDVAAVFWTSLRIGLILSFASLLLCFTASGPLSLYLLGSGEYISLFYLLSLDVFLIVLLPFFQAALQGSQRFRDMAVIGVINSFVRYGVAILALLFGFGLAGILLGWVLGDLVGVIFSAALTVRVFRNRGSHRFGPLIRYSAPLLASNLLSYLMGSADRYLILLLAGQDVLGIYSPAVTASSVLGVVSGAVGGALFPLLSRKLGVIDREAFREISRVSSRYVFLLYVPLAFGMAATAYPTMAFFVGERFLEGAIPLAILALASAFACGSVVVNSVLLAMGKTTIFSFASLLSIGSDLVLSFLLIGSLGPIGAALARASTLLVSFGLPALFLVRLKGQNLDLPAFKKSLAASSGMTLVVLAMQLIWMSKYLLPLYVVGGGLAYFAMLRALKTFNEEDFALISRLVPGKVRVLVSLLQKYLTSESSDFCP